MSSVKKISASEFGDYFPLDFAGHLASGLKAADIKQSSPVVRTLRDWAEERRSQVTRGQCKIGIRVCRDVLRSLAR